MTANELLSLSIIDQRYAKVVALALAHMTVLWFTS